MTSVLCPVADTGPAISEPLAGRYEIGDLVGVGGSAWVYRATDLITGREVAVKVYPLGAAEPARARRRREFDLLAGLHHPNLVEMLDAGEHRGRAYLVLELVAGPTLAERLRTETLPAAEVARLGASIADALGQVHRQGILHRDVKPANVLVGACPKLTDFGIARLLDTARVTQSGWLIGTPAYLPPELVATGESGTAGDVYALGLTLLEALTGRPEYQGDGAEVAFARLSRPPSVPDGLPGLSGLLRAMTDADPERRPTAAEVAEALRRAIPGMHNVTMLRPGGRAAHRRRDTGRPEARQRKLLAAALGLLGLGGAAVGMLSGSLRGADAESVLPALSNPGQVSTPAALDGYLGSAGLDHLSDGSGD